MTIHLASNEPARDLTRPQPNAAWTVCGEHGDAVYSRRFVTCPDCLELTKAGTACIECGQIDGHAPTCMFGHWTEEDVLHPDEAARYEVVRERRRFSRVSGDAGSDQGGDLALFAPKRA